MNIRTHLLKEPDLFFKGNNPCIDPQVGLLKYGPHGGFGTSELDHYVIKAGVIGTKSSIEDLKEWLQRLSYRIIATESNTDYQGIDFPGLGKKSPLRFSIDVDENCLFEISNDFYKKEIVKEDNYKKRILNLCEYYCRLLDDVKEAHPQPDILFLPIDEKILQKCKHSGRKTDKIVYQKRVFGDPGSYYAELFDFHNYIKAQAAIRGYVTQFLTPKTLAFSDTKQSPSMIAWNFSVGVYYKATGTPWKLADIDNNTCYIGVSFYNEISEKVQSVRASIAQVYMRTGESQVIRGQPFEWDSKNLGLTVRLSTDQMRDIVNDALSVYIRQRDQRPSRVVIHKSTRYTEDELIGCRESCTDVANLDIVHIDEYTRFRAYHDKNDFPVVRGTLIGDENEAMLFSTGYVPCLGTYPGPAVPRPLRITTQQLDTSMNLVARDILGLSKLDWNSSAFYTRLPVTIGVSRKVGAIMAELINFGGTPPQSYKFYM
ncbi:hypothetical protein JXL21_02220 [Candidatus Bathyarchaeota archaeon]|nr:hypothetical protein [Candidatus Bathyarchaeota archaeon]